MHTQISRRPGREITDEDKDNIKHIYTMIAGPMGVEITPARMRLEVKGVLR